MAGDQLGLQQVACLASARDQQASRNHCLESIADRLCPAAVRPRVVAGYSENLTEAVVALVKTSSVG